MKYGKLYEKLTKNQPAEQEKQDGESIINDASRTQLIQGWLQSTITQERVSQLHEEIAQLLDESIRMSVSYPTTNNHVAIIHNLIRVDTLQKELAKYAQR